MGRLCAAISIALCGAACAEMVDNPEYQNWARFKVGAFVRMKSEMVTGDNKIVSETLTRLVELTAEKLVLEVSGTTEMGGPKTDIPVQKVEVPARIEAPENLVEPGETPEAPPQMKTKQGEEELEVAGRKLKCKTSEIEMAQEGGAMTSKTWLCDEIPGGFARVDSATTGEQAMTSKMWVVEFKTE